MPVINISDTQLIFAPDVDYLIKIINHAGRTLQVFFEIDFYECVV